ncbi:hypothetical protein, partial [Bariatricus massiliensis]
LLPNSYPKLLFKAVKLLFNVDKLMFLIEIEKMLPVNQEPQIGSYFYVRRRTERRFYETYF